MAPTYDASYATYRTRRRLALALFIVLAQVTWRSSVGRLPPNDILPSFRRRLKTCGESLSNTTNAQAYTDDAPHCISRAGHLGSSHYLRKNAPPEAARLLPESDGIVYVNLRPLRAATHFDQRPVHRDPDYQRFIDATGFVFERDMDEAAFALHQMPDPNGPNGLVAFSEVFVGRFDGKKLAKYFEGQATLARGHTPGTKFMKYQVRDARCALPSLGTTWWPSRTRLPPSRSTPCWTATGPLRSLLRLDAAVAALPRDPSAIACLGDRQDRPAAG